MSIDREQLKKALDTLRRRDPNNETYKQFDRYMRAHSTINSEKKAQGSITLFDEWDNKVKSGNKNTHKNMVKNSQGDWESKGYAKTMDKRSLSFAPTPTTYTNAQDKLKEKFGLPNFQEHLTLSDAQRLSKEQAQKQQEKDNRPSFLKDVGATFKAAGQFFNPFDDVSAKEAVNNYLNRKTSKTFDEVSRGANRTVDSATLGLMSNVDKKVNDRQPHYTSQRKFGEGGGTDMLTSGLGYLVPGVGAYKALGATKVGKGIEAFGKQGIKQRVAAEAAKGSITGAGLAGTEVLNREVLNPDDYNWKQNAGHLALGTAAGAIADPAIYGLGKGIQSGLSRFAKGDVPTFTGQPSEEVLSQLRPQRNPLLPNGNNPLFDNLINNAPRPPEQSAIQKQLESLSSRIRKDKFLGFGQQTKNIKSRPLAPLESKQNQSYWQNRYEEFVKTVNDNYDTNKLTPEALEDLWSQFARYDEPVKLEEVVDLAYPRGFEANPIKQTTEPNISQNNLESAATIEQTPPSIRSENNIQTNNQFDDLAMRLDESNSPQGMARDNSLRPGRDYEPIEQMRGDGGPLVRAEPIDRTPIDIENPKEIVKRQINTDDKREKSKWSFDKFMTAVVDDLRPLDKATRQLGGKDIAFDKNPYTQARLARGVAGKAESYLKGGVYNDQGQKVGKSLQEIIKPIEKKMDDFLAYATSRRTLDYDEKGLTAGIKPKDVEGMSDRQLADATIRQLEAESPEFKEIHQELVKYNNTLLDDLVDAGVLTKESVESIRAENPNYIPMFRVQDKKVRGFEPLTNPKRTYANLGEPIKKRTGSEREIVNPIESMVKNTYLTLNMAERNRVGRSLLDLVEQADDNIWGRVLKTDKGMSVDDLGRSLDEAGGQITDGRTDAIDNLFKGEGNKVYVYKDGQRVEVELQEDLYKAMLSLDTQKQNFFIKMLGVPTRMLRTGAVLSPDFGPVNIFRDQFSAYVNSKYGFKPFVDMFSGLGNVLKKDDVYWSWKNSGGANSVLSSLDREYLQQDLRTMVKQSLWQNTKHRAKHPIQTMLEPLRKVSEITEEATRLGEFKKGLKKGATPKEAAFASRDLIDFNRAGNLGRQYNQITAFFNAAVQSIDKLARTFKDNPVRASIRAAQAITLPSVVAYMYNHDKEWYREIPQRERDLYWHFEIDDQIYKLPKPFEAGVMFGTVAERTLDALKTNDPAAFKDLHTSLLGSFTPPWLPTALAPWIEVYSNRSIHFDSPIVPNREQDMLPEDQYGPYQSELSKGLGKLTKTSPRKIEHVFRGYTGGLGKYFLQFTDVGAKGLGVNKPELPDRGLADAPILNRFVVKNLEGNNQSVNDFYDRMESLRRESLSAKKNKQANQNEAVYKQLNKLSRGISELQSAKREIIENPHMNGKEKADKIKEIDKRITTIAKNGNRLK